MTCSCNGCAVSWASPTAAPGVQTHRDQTRTDEQQGRRLRHRRARTLVGRCRSASATIPWQLRLHIDLPVDRDRNDVFDDVVIVAEVRIGVDARDRRERQEHGDQVVHRQLEVRSGRDHPSGNKRAGAGRAGLPPGERQSLQQTLRAVHAPVRGRRQASCSGCSGSVPDPVRHESPRDCHGPHRPAGPLHSQQARPHLPEPLVGSDPHPQAAARTGAFGGGA